MQAYTKVFTRAAALLGQTISDVLHRLWNLGMAHNVMVIRYVIIIHNAYTAYMYVSQLTYYGYKRYRYNVRPAPGWSTFATP